MFCTLPHSKQQFDISKISFANMFDISRFIYENDDIGFTQYLENHFNTHHLSVIDKFYVFLKASELYINDTLSLDSKGKTVNIYMKNILEKLNDLPNYSKSFTQDLITVTLNIPQAFINSKSSIIDGVIESIQIFEDVIEFNKVSKAEKDRILEALPHKFIKSILEYIQTINATITLVEETSHINAVSINFLGNDPINMIKTLYGEYSILNCRETLFYLSKRMNSDTILQSTPCDVKFYVESYGKELNSQSGDNVSPL